jgi:hypothetical protein
MAVLSKLGAARPDQQVEALAAQRSRAHMNSMQSRRVVVDAGAAVTAN